MGSHLDRREPVVDLRSDAITKPTPEMWRAMQDADLGWASAGEDPSVRQLEEAGARLSGKEDCVFVLTGTMANLAALMSHAERGDQVLLEASSHILWCEEWSMSYIVGLFPRALAGTRGKVEPEEVVRAVRESKYRHRPRTSLLCLENTDNIFGAALTPADIDGPASAARDLGVAVHLDGSRVMNACVACGVGLADMLAPVDSAMISLNKGLSAPGGALLVGPSEFIAQSRLNIRRLGGASHHRAGIYAAAGLAALDQMPEQLREDNRRAKTLASRLELLSRLRVSAGEVETNIVVVEIDPELGAAEDFLAELAGKGVLGYALGPRSVRFVTHRHIGDGDVERAADSVARVVGRGEP